MDRNKLLWHSTCLVAFLIQKLWSPTSNFKVTTWNPEWQKHCTVGVRETAACSMAGNKLYNNFSLMVFSGSVSHIANSNFLHCWFTFLLGRRLTLLVELASHLQRLCPRCSDPAVPIPAWGPFAVCHYPSLSSCFLLCLEPVLLIKPLKGQKINIYLKYFSFVGVALRFTRMFENVSPVLCTIVSSNFIRDWESNPLLDVLYVTLPQHDIRREHEDAGIVSLKWGDLSVTLPLKASHRTQ